MTYPAGTEQGMSTVAYPVGTQQGMDTVAFPAGRQQGSCMCGGAPTLLPTLSGLQQGSHLCFSQ